MSARRRSRSLLGLALALALSCSRGARDEGHAVSGVPSELAKTQKAPSCDGSVCDGQCVDLQTNPARCGECAHACASGEGCAAGLCAKPIAWGDHAVSAPPATCTPGERRAVLCPARATPTSVWGSDEYTADSSVCEAALHAGRVTTLGGSVAFELRVGAAAYAGSRRNGVTTQSWGAFTCGFVFVSGCAPGLVTCGDGCAAVATDAKNCGACGRACGADESCKAGTCVHGLAIDADTSLAALDALAGVGAACTPGKVRHFDCPPLGLHGGTVWGTDVYTHDSAICVAAVHAGRIPAATGGLVAVETMAGQASYAGSTRNGITTLAYGPWRCSFVFR